MLVQKVNRREQWTCSDSQAGAPAQRRDRGGERRSGV